MLKRLLNHNSIYTKLFLLFFIIGVLPLILGSYYYYSSSRKALLHSALQEQELEINSGMRNIVILFNEAGVNLLLTVENPSFVRYIEEADSGRLQINEQEKALKKVISLFPWPVESAGFADINGDIKSIVYNKVYDITAEGKTDISEEQYFIKAIKIEQGGVYYGHPEFSPRSQKWVIPVSTPVFDRKGRQGGVIYVQIYLDNIKKLIQGISHSEDIMFVIDNDGHLIAHTQKETGSTLTPVLTQGGDYTFRSIINRMVSGEGGHSQFSYNNRPAFISYNVIPGDKYNQNVWSIGVVTSEEAIYAGISVQRYILFLLSASSVLFAVAGILGWSISRPVNELTAASVAMSNGDLSARVRIRRDDEFGQLGNAFNKMAASIQVSHDELLRLSSTDGLTGLYNHREFQNRLNGEIGRSIRHKSIVSILMIDVDHFKKINDTYGHQSGDKVLSAIGAVILDEIRSSDFAARYGGEEMTVVLPETGPSDARIFSERLREKIMNNRVTVLGTETVSVTVSIGVASFPDDASDKGELVRIADQALYFAKKKGRNRTVLYGETIKAVLEKKPLEIERLLAQAEEWIFKDLATAVEARFPYKRGNFDAVTNSATQIGEMLKMGEEDIKELQMVAMLYEIGALAIPPDIFLKPGPLTEDERTIVNRHPELSVKLLSSVLKIQKALPAIKHHHERYDGTGYPSGLKGEEIPLLSRIISVVDSYYSMTSVTPYRRKMTPGEAVVELKDKAGSQFDPHIVDVFVACLKKNRFPT